MIYALSLAWLIGMMAAPVAIYWWIIRPKAKFTETAADDSFFPWLWEVAKRFRTLIIGFVGIVVTVLPDTLQILAGIDYQELLPAPWSIFAGPVTSLLLVLVRATATTPPGEPASGET